MLFPGASVSSFPLVTGCPAARARADAIMLDSSAKSRLRRLRSYALVRSQEQGAPCFLLAQLTEGMGTVERMGAQSQSSLGATAPPPAGSRWAPPGMSAWDA